MEDEIKLSCELLLNHIDSLIASSNSKTIILEFFKSEDCLFLTTEYKEGSNKVITHKTKLNIDVDDTSLFYQELFNQFRDRYVDNDNIKVQILKEIDFGRNTPFLSFRLHDRHLNEVDLRLKNLGNEKEVIDAIENQIMNLYNEKRTSRK